jgi:hypothetical protein
MIGRREFITLLGSATAAGIGQRNRDDLEWTSRQELSEPRIFFGMLAGTPQDRMRTNNQDATQ